MPAPAAASTKPNGAPSEDLLTGLTVSERDGVTSANLVGTRSFDVVGA